MKVLFTLPAIIKFSVFVFTVGVVLGIYLGSLAVDRDIRTPGGQQTTIDRVPVKALNRRCKR